MAKTRAQRKAERRRREAQQARGSDGTSRAQHRTQVPESADVIEAELAEEGADLIELAAGPPATEPAEPEPAAAEPEEPEPAAAPAPSRADVGTPATAEPGDRISRRARKQAERERQRRAKESAQRRQRAQVAPERQRGRLIGFFISCWAELKRVQWPDRETLIQASAVTVLFIAIAAAYLGALDSLFNFLVQHLL